MARQSSWWVRVAAAGGLALGAVFGAGSARAQEPKSTTIDLKLVERKADEASFSNGYAANKDGVVEIPFATASGKLKAQITTKRTLLVRVRESIRIDTNGDGVIDEKDAPAVSVSGSGQIIRVKVPVKLAGKTIDYPIAFQAYGSPENRYLLVGSGVMLESKFGDQTLRIIDDNVDGRFCGEGDRVLIYPAGTRERSLGAGGMQWTPTMEIAGKLYQLAAVNDSAQLKITPYTGPIAEVQIACEKPFTATATVTGEMAGSWTMQRPAPFVPGKYSVQSVRLQYGNEKAQVLYGQANPQQKPIELKAGKNLVKFGPPFKLDFDANRNGALVEITGVTVAGASGEVYRPYVQDAKTESFAWYVKAGGKEKQLAALQFG